jgi:hypothetical protein
MLDNKLSFRLSSCAIRYSITLLVRIHVSHHNGPLANLILYSFDGVLGCQVIVLSVEAEDDVDELQEA